jgi:hypothetical protein
MRIVPQNYYKLLHSATTFRAGGQGSQSHDLSPNTAYAKKMRILKRSARVIHSDHQDDSTNRYNDDDDNNNKKGRVFNM